MSEESNYWEKFIGKVVMIQLRSQPYIGVSGEELRPAVGEEGYMQTPLLRGKVVEVSGARISLETTDPDPELADNKVRIDLDADRDAAFVTVISKSLVKVA